MADLEKTVSIIFSWTDTTSNVMAGVGKNLDTLSGKVGDMTGPLANIASKFEIMGAGIAAAIGVGVGAAVSATGKFDESFSEITTLIDAPIDKVDDFKNAVLDYARDSTQPLDTITGALYDAISAGIPYSESIDALRVAEQLAVAGRGEFQSTTSTLAGLLNAYGESADKAGDYSDTLFKAVAIGQTTLSEMSGKLGPLVSIAASAGVPFEELAGAIAVLTANGTPTPQAIDAIRGAISNIIKPSEQAKKQADELGISFGSEALKAKGLPGLLADISKATGDNIQPTSVLFGDVNALSGALVLSKDGSAKYKDAMGEISTSNGIVVKNFGIMKDEISNIHSNLSNNISVTLIDIGSKIIDKYGEIVGSLSELFKNVDFTGTNFQPLFEILNSVGTDINDFIADIAKNLPEALANVNWTPIEGTFGNLKDMFKGLMDAIFGDDVDLSSAEGLTKAIDSIVKAFSGIGNVISGIGKSFTPFIKTIVDGLKSAADSNTGTQEFTGKLLGMGQALNVIAGLGGGAAGVIGGVAGVLSTLVNLKLASMVTNIGGLSKGLGALSKVGAIAMPVTVSILGGQALAELVYSLIPGLKEWDKKAFEVTVDIAGSLYDLLIGDAVAKVGGWGAQLGDKLGDAIVLAFGSKKLEMPKTDFRSVQNDWDALNLEMDAYIETQTDFDSVQSDWDAITEEMENSPISIEADLNTDGLLEGLEEITDYPPDIDPLPVDVDDASIDKTKKKIKQSFSKAEMGPVDLDIDFGENGMGPANSFKNSFETMAPIPMEDLFDPSGMADLFSALNEATDPRERAMLEKAISDQIKYQAQMSEAQIKTANISNAAAEQMLRAANVMQMSGEYDNTITIDAQGLEPEMEAFMWKLLKKIQVRAHEAGAEFLLAAAGA